ncbi:MAG: hypothetical protein MI923_19110 [Phycisphaerales bacterium]|nr:hypothetical protein [Phycisphaerales bacterium]
MPKSSQPRRVVWDILMYPIYSFAFNAVAESNNKIFRKSITDFELSRNMHC